jgi:hypothetical protein
MRQDKEKVKTLASKTSSLKKRAKSAKNLHSTRSLSPSREAAENRRSLSPDSFRRRYYDSATDVEMPIPGTYRCE